MGLSNFLVHANLTRNWPKYFREAWTNRYVVEEEKIENAIAHYRRKAKIAIVK
jgi:hypothetical protein